MNILFNKPYMTGKVLWYISQAHARGHLAGDGQFTKKCNAWLEQRIHPVLPSVHAWQRSTSSAPQSASVR